MHPHVHCSIVFNNQDKETTEVSISDKSLLCSSKGKCSSITSRIMKGGFKTKRQQIDNWHIPQ